MSVFRKSVVSSALVLGLVSYSIDAASPSDARTELNFNHVSKSAPPPADVSPNPCDLNLDGTLDQTEIAQCPYPEHIPQFVPPEPDPCDLNGDFTITIEEQEQCPDFQQYQPEPGTEYVPEPDPCDLNSDFMITVEEMVGCVDVLSPQDPSWPYAQRYRYVYDTAVQQCRNDPASCGITVSGDTGELQTCASVDSRMTVNIPCVHYNGDTYDVQLDYVGQMQWRLGASVPR